MPTISVPNEAHIDGAKGDAPLATPVFALARPFFTGRPLERITPDNRDLHAPRVFGFRFVKNVDRVGILPPGHYDPETQTFISTAPLMPVDEITFSHITEVQSGIAGDDGQVDHEPDHANGR